MPAVPVEPGVGAGGDGDLVLAALVDHDRRHARGDLVELRNRSHVNPLRGQLAQRLVAEVVSADGAYDRHARSGAGGRDCLVRALAAAVAGEGAAGHCLAGSREGLDRDHEVGVDRPDDDHRGLRHGRRGYGANVNCGWVGKLVCRPGRESGHRPG
jgi:hypothetical protein